MLLTDIGQDEELADGHVDTVPVHFWDRIPQGFGVVWFEVGIDLRGTSFKRDPLFCFCVGHFDVDSVTTECYFMMPTMIVSLALARDSLCPK